MESEEIQSTIGIDQDLWCYKKNRDVVRGISNTISITFYVWDFAGQVGRYNYDTVQLYTHTIYRRNTQLLISVLSLTGVSMCCVGGHVMEKMGFWS